MQQLETLELSDCSSKDDVLNSFSIQTRGDILLDIFEGVRRPAGLLLQSLNASSDSLSRERPPETNWAADIYGPQFRAN